MKEAYPDELSGYEPYVVNRSFSFNQDSIMMANEINKPDIDSTMNFDFYYYGLSKKKRFGKWSKKVKISQGKIDYINNIIEYYNCSMEKAQETYEVLEKCGLLKDFDALVEKGGKSK